MRSLILYCIVVFSSLNVLGCNKDSTSYSDIGMIVGEWEGYSKTLVFEDGNEEQVTSGNCEGYILQFYEDGRLHWLDFIKSEEGTCIENDITGPMGVWERVSTGKYVFTLVNSLDDSELLVIPNSVVFKNDGIEKMELHLSEITEDLSKKANYYITLYRR